jgi:hypothetical protein
MKVLILEQELLIKDTLVVLELMQHPLTVLVEAVGLGH